MKLLIGKRRTSLMDEEIVYSDIWNKMC